MSDKIEALKQEVIDASLELLAHQCGGGMSFGGNPKNDTWSIKFTCPTQRWLDAVAEYKQAAEAERRLPTIKEMSGLVHDFTNGKSMKEYMGELSDE
jgi:hypothetical protein